MGAPKSGELDALLGKGGGLSEAPLRHSKLVSKRHPDGVWLQGPQNVTQRWVSMLTGRADVVGAEMVEGMSIDFRWRVHPWDRGVKMVVSPLTAVHGLVSGLPEGYTWGLIQSPTLELVIRGFEVSKPRAHSSLAHHGRGKDDLICVQLMPIHVHGDGG